MKINETENAAFSRVCREVVSEGHERYNIGTYKEKKLHLILKKYFEPDARFHEVPYGGYICDVKRDDLITEVQTTGLRTMSRKLAAFLPECRVRIVFPIITEKRIFWVDPADGTVSEGKKSPKKENGFKLLSEMLYISDYLSDENLTVTAVYIRADEYRMLNGWSRDRKRGSHRFDTIPVQLRGELILERPEDYMQLVPEDLPEPFTAADFATAAGIPRALASTVMLLLTETGTVLRVGKQGRAWLYRLAEF